MLLLKKGLRQGIILLHCAWHATDGGHVFHLQSVLLAAWWYFNTMTRVLRPFSSNLTLSSSLPPSSPHSFFLFSFSFKSLQSIPTPPPQGYPPSMLPELLMCGMWVDDWRTRSLVFCLCGGVRARGCFSYFLFCPIRSALHVPNPHSLHTAKGALWWATLGECGWEVRTRQVRVCV